MRLHRSVFEFGVIVAWQMIIERLDALTRVELQMRQHVQKLLNEEIETLELASAAGFRCFTDATSFRAHVEMEILAVDAIAAD